MGTYPAVLESIIIGSSLSLFGHRDDRFPPFGSYPHCVSLTIVNPFRLRSFYKAPHFGVGVFIFSTFYFDRFLNFGSIENGNLLGLVLGDETIRTLRRTIMNHANWPVNKGSTTNFTDNTAIPRDRRHTPVDITAG